MVGSMPPLTVGVRHRTRPGRERSHRESSPIRSSHGNMRSAELGRAASGGLRSPLLAAKPHLADGRVLTRGKALLCLGGNFILNLVALNQT